MNDSKKQLIAQIHRTEAELYVHNARTALAKNYIKSHKGPYTLGVLIVAVVTTVWVFKSKNNFKEITRSIVTAGKLAIISYCKKQITHLLQSN